MMAFGNFGFLLDAQTVAAFWCLKFLSSQERFWCFQCQTWNTCTRTYCLRKYTDLTFLTMLQHSNTVLEAHQSFRRGSDRYVHITTRVISAKLWCDNINMDQIRDSAMCTFDSRHNLASKFWLDGRFEPSLWGQKLAFAQHFGTFSIRGGQNPRLVQAWSSLSSLEGLQLQSIREFNPHNSVTYPFRICCRFRDVTSNFALRPLFTSNV